MVPAIDTPGGSFDKHTITISDGEPITVGNVLVGEVRLASGQSNMQMPLKGFPGCCTEGGYDEIASSRRQADKVRFFTVPLTRAILRLTPSMPHGLYRHLKPRQNSAHSHGIRQAHERRA